MAPPNDAEAMRAEQDRIRAEIRAHDTEREELLRIANSQTENTLRKYALRLLTAFVLGIAGQIVAIVLAVFYVSSWKTKVDEGLVAASRDRWTGSMEELAQRELAHNNNNLKPCDVRAIQRTFSQ